MALHRDAEEAGAAFVLADRQHGTAKGRAQHERHGTGDERKAEQDEVVEGLSVGDDIDREKAEVERLARKAAQAIVAAGQRTPLERDIIEYLPERDRHHGEVD